MADVAVVHNFSENPGGGDLVALDIIEALVESGEGVWLYTSRPEGPREAVRLFLKDPRLAERVEVRRVSVPRAVRHPYNIYLMARRVLGELKQYDLVVFFDDIPRPAEELRRVMVYTHYPHAARILLGELVPYRYRGTARGRLAWRLHSRLFKSLFLMNWGKPSIYAVANSTLTQRHVAEALKPIQLAKIYPPVQVEQITKYLESNGAEKGDEVAYVGRIQAEKGVDEVIKALAQSRDRDVKASIVGFHFDAKYLRYLRNLARELGVENRVTFKFNASRNEVLQTLARAKILIHPAHQEPFGIAVVEGMAAGCIPVVRRGLNGPWIDIVKKGKYGYGYDNVSELAKIIIRVIIYKDININKRFLGERAQDFSETTFKEKFKGIVKKLELK